MESYDQLVKRYRGKGLLVDANLLLLLTIGRCDPGLIQRFKRTQKYDMDDFGGLARVVGLFRKHVTIPHVLTEISNLATSLPEHIRPRYFTSLVSQFEPYSEETAPFAAVSRMGMFVKFGVTDTAITHIARNKYLVLTDDFPLANFLQKQKQDVINFNHLRQMAWSLGA